MNRRGFLTFLGVTSIAATLDPEKLLWIPDQKKIFIPSSIRYLSMDEINEFTFRLLGNSFALTPKAELHYRRLADYLHQKNVLGAHHPETLRAD